VNSAKAILTQTIDPPDLSAIDAALCKLAALGALTSSSDTSDISALGRQFSTFPGDLTLAKLTAYGGALGGVPDAIILAAVAATIAANARISRAGRSAVIARSLRAYR
jgi:HrpA-like RNA helicase